MPAAAEKQKPSSSPNEFPSPSSLKGGVREQIEDNRSADLVFAVVGYLGSGATHVTEQLLSELDRAYAYKVGKIKISDLIEPEAQQFGCTVSKTPKMNRTTDLQNAGDVLREKLGTSILAGLAIERIGTLREELLRVPPAEGETPKPIAFVIDSLKHPDEAEALRDVYGSSFYLISIVSDWSTRLNWLKEARKYGSDPYKGDALEAEIIKLMKRDEQDADNKKTGQQVRKTLHLADYFINNSANSLDILKQIDRLLDLITGKKIYRPSLDERGMHAAWGASMLSACLSRQVGAAIMSHQGDIIATGANDVPKSGGGLYQNQSAKKAKDRAEQETDNRCFNTESPAAKRQLLNIRKLQDGSGAIEEPKSAYCRNDIVKQTIYRDIFENINKVIQGLKDKDVSGAGFTGTESEEKLFVISIKKLLSEKLSAVSVRGCIEATPVKDLIEFSRAVHAETDAIISLARTGGPPCKGGTLYCTTYPCHSCARHIVAAGLREVVYVEPYPKSMALNLHDDAIEESAEPLEPFVINDVAKKVRFRLFSGVAPRRFSDLFEKRVELKTDGFATATRMRHYDPFFRETYIGFEKAVSQRVRKDIEKVLASSTASAE